MQEIRLWLPPSVRRFCGAGTLGLSLAACGGQDFDADRAADGGETHAPGRDGGHAATGPRDHGTDGGTLTVGDGTNFGGGSGPTTADSGPAPSETASTPRPSFVSTLSAVGSGASTEHHLTLWVGTPGPLGTGASSVGAHVLRLSPISSAR